MNIQNYLFVFLSILLISCCSNNTSITKENQNAKTDSGIIVFYETPIRVDGEFEYDKAIEHFTNYEDYGYRFHLDSMFLFLQLSIKKNNVKAHSVLGHFLLYGHYCKENIPRAIYHLEYAAKRNDGAACFDLGTYYFCTGNIEKSIGYMEKADELGVMSAILEVYRMYMDGYVTFPITGCQHNESIINETLAESYLIKSVQKGNLYSKFEYLAHLSYSNPDTLIIKQLALELLSDTNINHYDQLKDDLETFLTEKYGRNYFDSLKIIKN